MRRLQSIILAVMLLWMGALPTWAAPWELRGGTDAIEKRQVVTGDLFFSGETLEIEGEVRGDLIVFARQVLVRGRITGSILGLVTEQLTIEGEVAGNVRVLAGNLSVEGKVGQMVSSYALRMNTSKNSIIETGILGSFAELKLTGQVNGPVDVKVYSLNRIGGRINSRLTSRGAPIEWLAPLQINGRVDDYSGVSSQPPNKVSIAKGYHYHPLKTESPGLYKYLLLVSVIWFLGSLLMSLIFFRLFPRTAWNMAQPSVENVRNSLLVGIITLVGVPIVCGLLLLTTVGLPIALVVGLIYISLLIFSGVPFSILLGRIVFRQYQDSNPQRPNLLVISGCLFASLISALPLIGYIIPTCLGLGMIVRKIKPEFKEVRLEIGD